MEYILERKQVGAWLLSVSWVDCISSLALPKISAWKFNCVLVRRWQCQPLGCCFQGQLHLTFFLLHLDAHIVPFWFPEGAHIVGISACSCIVCWLSLFWLASSLSATAFFSCSSPCLSCLLSFLKTHSFSCASVIISPPWSTEQIPSLQLHGPDAVFPARFQEQLFHSAADGSCLVRSSCLSCNLRNSTGAVAWSGSSPWAVFAAVQGAPFLQASLCLAQH